MSEIDHADRVAKVAANIRHEIGKVIVGQDAAIECLLVALLTDRHCFMVGLPGLAKTLIVSTMAQVLQLSFKRIQFTPDLMPSDITGAEIIQEDPETGQRHFSFFKGPIFANLLLADEINRTPPKTQAALLEAMQERQVTAANQTHQLAPPFFVLATQNPLDQEGTYPLPEAQLDRFMMSVVLTYPPPDDELEILKKTTVDEEYDVKSILTAEQVIELQQLVRRVPVGDHVFQYTLELTRKTRPADPIAPDSTRQWVEVGAGPRAGQNLILGAKARALMEGRCYVSCHDVAALAKPVLRHRISTNFNADSEGVTSDDLIDRIVAETAIHDGRS